MAITLSPDQDLAVKAILDWYANPTSQIFTLVGYAGVGKTSLAAHLRNVIKGSIAYISYTGKAASVLRTKLQDQVTLQDDDYVGTLHGLIYRVNVDGKIITFTLRESLREDIDLIVVDESSMIGVQIFKDVTSFGIPILFIGDDAQLPPIKDLPGTHLSNPDFKLTKIHRQAEGNPIISFSKGIREGDPIIEGPFAPNVNIYDRGTKEGLDKLHDLKINYDINKDMFLCGFNNTRLKLNQDIRKILGFTKPEPMIGDKVICLRNNKSKKIFNGMIGIIEEISGTKEFSENQYTKHKCYKMTIKFGDVIYKGWCLADQFNNKNSFHTIVDGIKYHCRTLLDVFDFGYSVSVHKFQGSEFSNIIVIREECKIWNQKQWDYTAITRAVDNLTIFI